MDNALAQGQPVPLETQIYTIDLGDGERDVMSFLPTDIVFNRGLPEIAIIGTFTADVRRGEPLPYHEFQENGAFVDLLHRLVAVHAPTIPELQAEARRQGDGFVYVIDGRTATPDGQVPPEDIIGGFEVNGGILVPDSYRGSPNHRLLTQDGIFRSPPVIETHLWTALIAAVDGHNRNISGA